MRLLYPAMKMGVSTPDALLPLFLKLRASAGTRCRAGGTVRGVHSTPDRLLKVNYVCQTMTEERPLPEPRRNRQLADDTALLEVRVKDQLHNGENPAGLECAEQCPQGRSAIRNLAKYGHKDCAIKVIFGKRVVAECRRNERDIGTLGLLHLDPGAREHPRLNVERDDMTGWPNISRKRYRQTTGATTRIEDCHAIGKPERVDNEPGAVRLGKRIVEFN